MDLTRRRFLALAGAVGTAPLWRRHLKPPAPSSGWWLCAVPGRMVPGALWPGGAL